MLKLPNFLEFCISSSLEPVPGARTGARIRTSPDRRVGGGTAEVAGGSGARPGVVSHGTPPGASTSSPAPSPGASPWAAAPVILLHPDVRSLSLMGPELGVIELSNAVLHVIIAQEFNHSCSILIDIGIAHISRLPHVVLQVLPAAGRGQACHTNSVLGSSGGRAPSSAPWGSQTAAATHHTISVSWELHPQSVSIIVVRVPHSHCILRIPWIFKLNKSKWWAFLIFQINIRNFPKFVE